MPGTTPSIPGVTRKNFVVDAATSRLTISDGCAMTYDAAGNQTYDCVGTHSYDAKNRMTKAVQGSSNNYYFHDGNGKRVRRILNGAQTWGGQETWFVYGFDGEPAAEYAYNQVTAPLATAPQKEYGYRGGKLLVVWDGDKSRNEQLKWLVQDHLGSTRMGSDKSGSLGGMRRHDYAPFGEEMYAGIRRNGGNGQYGYEPPQSSVKQRFVGYERDNETGLDFAQARYFSNTQGRFTSIDPLMESAKPGNPQSWNRYAYVLNNPLVYIDPTGLFWIASGDVNNPYSWVDQCPQVGTCYASVAAVVNGGVSVYGSRNARDITPYAANANGVVNVTDIANHHDAQYDSVAGQQPHPEHYLSPDKAAALFNVARDYAATYPNDDNIVFTAGSADTGNAALNAAGRPVHDSHRNGQNIDIRYMGANGNSLIGPNAAATADVNRMDTLFDGFSNQRVGLGAALTGDPARFGFQPIREDLRLIHRDHFHLQRTYPALPPPPAARRRR